MQARGSANAASSLERILMAKAVRPRRSTQLKQLARDANDAHRRGLNSAKATMEEWFTAGRALLKAKAMLDHGQWLPWLKENCPNISERQAQRYMKLAEREADIRAKSDMVSDLTMQAALDLVAPTKHWPPREGQEYIGPWPPTGMVTPPPRGKGGKLPLDAGQQAWIDQQIEKQNRIAAEGKRVRDEAAAEAAKGQAEADAKKWAHLRVAPPDSTSPPPTVSSVKLAGGASAGPKLKPVNLTEAARDQVKQAAQQFNEMVTNARANGVLREPDDNDLFEAARLGQVWLLRITARALDRAADEDANARENQNGIRK
jgi:hypothetical protein